MRLNKEKTLELTTALQKKWKPGFACGACGNNQWIVENNLFELREFNPQKPEGKSPVMPIIPIICRNCGNTHLINPIVMGLTLEGNKSE